MTRISTLVKGLFKQKQPSIRTHLPAVDNRKPRVETIADPWNRENGFRVVVYSLHQDFRVGAMHSIEHARHLAKELNAACDEAERQDVISQ